MEKLTEIQRQKFEILATAINNMKNVDIGDDMELAIIQLWQAGQDFRSSLPLAISDEQLKRRWDDELPEDAEVTDWEPQTSLEDDLFLILRNLWYTTMGTNIYQFIAYLENASTLVEQVRNNYDK